MKKIHTPIKSSMGNQEMKILVSNDCSSGAFGLDAHTVLQQVIHQPDVVRRIGDEAAAILALAAHGVAVDLHLCDLLAFHLLHECGEIHRGRRSALTGELGKQAHEHQPDNGARWR